MYIIGHIFFDRVKNTILSRRKNRPRGETERMWSIGFLGEQTARNTRAASYTTNTYIVSDKEGF